MPMDHHQRLALLPHHLTILAKPLAVGIKHRQPVAKARRDVTVDKLLPLFSGDVFPRRAAQTEVKRGLHHGLIRRADAGLRRAGR